MRKFSLLLVILTLFTGVTFAQDAKAAKKVLKTGSKALSKYISNNANMDALESAKKAASEAVTLDPTMGKAWLLKGNTYAAKVKSASAMISQKLVEHQASLLKDPTAKKPTFAGLNISSDDLKTAISAYQKASEVDPKKKKKAVSAIKELGLALNNISNTMLDEKRYTDAFPALNQSLAIHKFMVDNGGAGLFPEENMVQQQKYVTAIVANTAGKKERAKELFKGLYDAKYNEASVYSNYSQLLISEGNEDEGLKVLSKGREAFPDNSDILFAEINYYIKKGDNKALETMLQKAIEKEPNNVGLYTALGNVYMSLSGDAKDNTQKSTYAEKAISYFNKGIELDDKNVDAIYSIGSYYFNEAVALNVAMNALGTSKADQKKYDEYKNQITVLFDKALPYFQKAEKLDPNDRNTLIALKEIYARKNDYSKSNEYKARLDKIDGGK